MDPAPLHRAVAHATDYLETLPERPVGPRAGVDELRAVLGGALPDRGVPAAQVVDELAAGADAGLVATPGPRFFGWVIGGSLPAALAADWLVAAWDQHASFDLGSPAAAAIERTAAGWALDLLGLPAGASVGLVTGAQMASAVALAAARGAVLRRVGWDVEADGLIGAPPVEVFVGEQVHASLLAALRLLGFGAERAVRIPVDAEGRMVPEALAAAVAAGGSGPAIVCAQAGEVNTGASDPLDAVADIARERGAWLHVDGAFGLWAAASPAPRHLVHGCARADSWAVDAHKWLNVPYDCALAIVADPEAHVAAMRLAAAYLPGASEPNAADLVPEASRRARGVPVYAALRSLGREGVAELVDRCCDLATQMAEKLAASGRLRVLNEVSLNQVLAVPEGVADEELADRRPGDRGPHPGRGDVLAGADRLPRHAGVARVDLELVDDARGRRRSAAAIVAATEAETGTRPKAPTGIEPV